MSTDVIYDLLLKGGHVIDPANNIDKKMDAEYKFEPETAKFKTRFIHLFQRIPIALLLLFTVGFYFIVLLLLI